MARTPDLEMKRQLLDQIVAYLAEHGLGDMSLRPMAAALGKAAGPPWRKEQREAAAAALVALAGRRD